MSFLKKIFNEKNYNKIIIAILIIGLVLRLFYVLTTDFEDGNHNHDQLGGDGHMDYAFYIYYNHSLPEHNVYAFSHPPFFHFLVAMWFGVIGIFNSEYSFLLSSMPWLGFIVSLLTMLIVIKILKQLNIHYLCKIIAFLYVSISSYFIVFTGFTNNDPMAFLLSLFALLYLIKWYKKESFKNIILMAIFTGCAVMTKVNAGMIAIPISIVFIYKLFVVIKDNNRQALKNIIMQLSCFAIISLPLGLWYPIRNLILFKQPIIYVFDHGNTDLYVGDVNYLTRLSPFSDDIIMYKYDSPFEASNIPTYVLKGSLFGEFDWNMDLDILLYFALGFHAITIFMEFIIIALNKKHNLFTIATLGLLIANVISYLIMNYKLPYGCTMDFRYLVHAWFAFTLLFVYSMSSYIKEKKLLGSIVFGKVVTYVCALLLIFIK